MNIVNIPSKFLKICRGGTFLDLHNSESILKLNNFAVTTAGSAVICCEARVWAKGLEGGSSIEKLSSIC